MSDRLKTTIGILIFIFILLLIILFRIKVKNYHIYGNTMYEDYELIDKIFESENKILKILIKDKIYRHKKINHIESYEISYVYPTDLQIVVYENKEVGYIRYMSSNFYFDKDGYVMGATQEKKPGVPEYIGINFNSLVIGQKIGITNKTIFNTILNISNNISRCKLPVDTVFFNAIDDIVLKIENVDVKLGDNKNMEYKFTTLSNMYEQIKSLKGVLDLSQARDNMINEQYIFTVEN